MRHLLATLGLVLGVLNFVGNAPVLTSIADEGVFVERLHRWCEAELAGAPVMQRMDELLMAALVAPKATEEQRQAQYIDCAQALVNVVYRELQWANPPRVFQLSPEERRGVHGRYYFETHTIGLEPNALVRTVLHEIAHAATPRQGHGRDWLAVHIHLLAERIPGKTRESLAQSARRYGLPVVDSRDEWNALLR